MNSTIRFISAGAGSGKTFFLAELLHHELTEGRVVPSGVLATTFTNRAAAELRSRVAAQLISKQAFGLATQMSQARIGTVNSVCGQLLQHFAFEAGMSTEQIVLDEYRAEQLLRESIDVATESEALEKLLWVAGRLGLRTDPQGGPPPWRTALRMLIDQARANAIDAAALRQSGPENARQLLAYFPPSTETGLDSALALQIERVLPSVHAAALLGKKKVTIAYLELLEAAARQLAQGDMSWAAWVKLSKSAPEKNLQDLVQGVADSAGKYLQHERLHADVADYLTGIFALAGAALLVYEQRKNESGEVDFIDQERRLLDVLELPAVAQTLSEALELLLVDEFQDTSPIQLALFLRLARHAKAVVWVGDVKQAIYGFRGSDAELMRAVVDSLPLREGGPARLPNSWRSRPPLVHFVNQLFGNVFPGLAAQDVHLEPVRADIAGSAVEDWILEGASKDAQYRALSAGIAALLAEGRAVVDREDGRLRPLRCSDIAVLARSNSNVASLAAALQLASIPCAADKTGLLATPECVLAVACLRYFCDSADTLACAEIVSLVDGLEPEMWLADRLCWLSQGGAADSWRHDATVPSSSNHIFWTLKNLRELAEVFTPSEWVAAVVARCHLTRLVQQWQTDTPTALQRIGNLDRLVTQAAQYEADCQRSRESATFAGLLLNWRAQQEQSQDDCARPELDAVQVLTHHGAKGLEWPVVVLCDLNANIRDGLWDVQTENLAEFDAQEPLGSRFLRYWPWPFGAQKQLGFAHEMAQSTVGRQMRLSAVNEAQRLLYVSMTRARDLLILARPAKKMDGEWMQTIALDDVLPKQDGATDIRIADKPSIRFKRQRLSPPDAV